LTERQQHESPRRKRLLTSYVAGLIYLFVRAGQQVALLPAFLFAWGAGLYGQWILLSSAAAFIALIDLGTRPYLHNRLLLQREAADHAGYRRTFQVSLAIMFLAVCAGLTVLAAGALFALKTGLLDNDFLDADSAAFLLFGLGVRALMEIPLDILSNPHWARREVTRNIALNTIWLALELSAMVCGLLLQLSPLAIAVISLVVRGAFIAYLTVEIPWRYPELRVLPALPTTGEASVLLRMGLSYLGLPIAQLASFQGLVIVLSVVSAGPLAVVTFTAIRMLVSFLRQILERIGGLTVAELARSYAGNDNRALVRIYSTFARLFGGLAGLLVGAVWVYAPVIVPILTAGKVEHEPAVLQFLLLGLILGLPGVPVSLMFHQINRPGPLLVILVPQIAATLSLTLVLGGPYGAAGAAAAVAIPEILVGLLWLPIHGARTLPLPIPASIGRMLLASIAAGFASALIAAATLHLIDPTTVIEQMLVAISWAALVTLPGFFIMLGGDQRRWLYSAVRRRG
jgi:O-antigen/teichoic acid export membrane protein